MKHTDMKYYDIVAVITKPVSHFSLHGNFSLHQKIFFMRIFEFSHYPKNSLHSPTQPKNYFWVREFYEEKISRISGLVVTSTICIKLERQMNTECMNSPIWDLECNTIQYNTIQYNTIQYNTIQYNTIQYDV